MMRRVKNREYLREQLSLYDSTSYLKGCLSDGMLDYSNKFINVIEIISEDYPGGDYYNFTQISPSYHWKEEWLQPRTLLEKALDGEEE